jgi:hypothetical protein
MQQRIEYARRQAADARQKAIQCTDERMQSEWGKAARMWDEIAEQCELLRSIGEPGGV